MWDTYKRIYNRLGLDVIVVESDNGYIGGEYCHEFIVESEVGESKFLVSEDGTYAAHEDIAKFKRDGINQDEETKRWRLSTNLHGFRQWNTTRNITNFRVHDSLKCSLQNQNYRRNNNCSYTRRS